MGSTTVGIIFDSLRHDFITPENTPVLYSMQEQGLSGTLKELLGFMMSPGWFAGIYPETSGFSQTFRYSPETSPYGIARIFPACLEKRVLLNKVSRRIIQKWVEWRAVHPVMKSYSYTYRIPFRLLPFFDGTEKKYPWEAGYLPAATLFDLLRQKGLIGYPGNNLRTGAVLEKLEKSLPGRDYAFIWLHFAELDWVEHEYGPDSDEVRTKLKEIDNAIGRVKILLEKKYDPINWLILGDHGTVQVKGKLDIEEKLRTLDLMRGEDYIYFLDSTLARFWFNNSRAKDLITDMLKGLQEGKILEKEDLARYRSNHSGTSNWELLFMANEGIVIQPNFYQGYDPVNGMHGYLPDVRNNMASFVLLNGSREKGIRMKEIRDMTDVFPTLCDLIGLPLPDSCEGRSLLKKTYKHGS